MRMPRLDGDTDEDPERAHIPLRLTRWMITLACHERISSSSRASHVKSSSDRAPLLICARMGAHNAQHSAVRESPRHYGGLQSSTARSRAQSHTPPTRRARTARTSRVGSVTPALTGSNPKMCAHPVLRLQPHSKTFPPAPYHTRP